ncbi:MAG: hypothetical protein K0R09_2488 [Clostridiales bacterium]|jgi:predicted Zn-dependent protease|nr:hypothetical protein [Clostridiales bacterium]
MLSRREANEVIDRVLSYCKYYTMVSISSEEHSLTRFANSEIHQNVFNADNSVTIKVYNGKKESKVITNLLTEEGLRQAVEDAEENLKFMPDGDIQVPEVISPEEILSEEYDEKLEKVFNTINRARLIKEGIDLLDRDYTAAGALSLNKEVIAMGNSQGIRRYARLDNVDFSIVVTHMSGVSGYGESNSDKANDINVINEFEVAYNKARMGINPVSIEPGSYTVILEPLAVADLLGYMNYVGFSARSAQMGTGYLTGKIGQKVFGENITVIDDVNNENTMPLYFDFEGYERKTLNIIENGIVKELAYDIKSAIKDGVETTGHSVGQAGMGGLPLNLVMEGGNQTMEELIKSTPSGILITRFHYMNIVDPRQAILTALTRDGLFMIEDGKIKSGVKNMRFTESMLMAFNKVVGITKERKKTSGYYVPAVKIEDFHFTGKTE